MKKEFKFLGLNLFEILLWVISLITITLSFIIAKSNDYLTLVGSLIGVTALIYLAKGYIISQILVIIFSCFYGIISYYFRYYGELITYVGMTLPMAIITLIEWLKHRYKDSNQVEISSISKTKVIIMIVLSIIVTAIFYFILKALGTTNLIVSTISITTSFIAAYLTFFRSPYYALGYATNDIVLIVLWILASIENLNYVPMVLCFVMFLFNDLYGFYNWKKMQKLQFQENKR